jgi:hypothetical protein
MTKIVLSAILIAALSITAQADAPAASAKQAQEAPAKTTKVTEENYSLAETQVIFGGYVKKIAAATGTNGVGVWMHNKEGADPKDRTIMRINFDTIYSFVVLDLTEPATLVMPESNGRYQNAWFITEGHHNPRAINKPGTYTITQKDVGSRYIMIAIRTQANVEDPKDMAIANALQDKLEIHQKDRGSYKASNSWNMDEILKMRKHYQKITKDKGYTTDDFFGPEGTRSLELHNCGTSFGWGGMTKDQAAYPNYYAKSSKPQTFTLKDVPAKAFWSITVYDAGGYPQTDTYNINSQFAKKNADGSVVIHFGGDAKADNYMEIFEGWTFILRMYLPTDAYLDGTWKRPELVEVK